MPKFSQNPTSPSGGLLTISPSGPYTVETFDTFVAYDMVVFAPSVRSTMETTPIFKQTIAGEVENIGSFGAPLEDYRGQNANTTTAAQFQGIYGSTGFGTKVNNFYNVICASGTTTTGARQAALDAVLADPDYATIKANMKYPFKVYNQVKGVSDFTFTNLLDLNGLPLVNTGANGVTSYNTTITTTSYLATGNVLPIAQNVNSTTGGKMGLFLFFQGVGMPEWYDLYVHQVASLGYVAVSLPSNQISSYYCRYGGKKTTAQLLADRTITQTSTANSANGNAVSTTGYFYNGQEIYGSGIDSVGAGGSTNGFWRSGFGSNCSQPAAATNYERYFYQIKCGLKQIGLGDMIDYNNVAIAGISFGAQCISYMNRIADTGNAVYYDVQGVKPFLFKPRAFISFQGNHIDYSYKTGMGASTYNETNNRFITANMHPLRVPTFFLTGEGDVNGFGGNIIDNRFNNQYQTILQMTKQQASTASDIVLGLSAVFYRNSIQHYDISIGSSLVPNFGRFGTIYSMGFSGDWLQGWTLPLNPTFPSVQNAYESGLLDERIYVQCVDLNINTLIACLAHRFLGREFPVPMDAFSNFGLRCDVGATACDVYTDHEYMRVGPWGMITYDYNYNLTLTNVPGATGATQPPVSFYATGSGQTIAATTLTATSALNMGKTLAVGTGAITANTPAGTVVFGPADASITVSNSLVTANSIIIATVAANDATLKSVVVVASPGSFVITPNALATADSKINWLVIN
jgi:hypothetical protein